MMNQEYRRLLLSELRLSTYIPGTREITDADMTFAATLNENLLSLGYTLTPADLLRLMHSPSRTDFYQSLKDSMGEIKAQPMYPDFPNQVMAMDEAQFRFHQLVHYFSTYGLEDIFGSNILRGWLPDVQSTEKTAADTRLLNAKIIELVPEEAIHRTAFQKILSKRERMGDKERELIRLALANEKAKKLIDGVTIRFKENLMDVFYTVFDSESAAEDKLTLLHAVCQHTGDVFKCLDFTLTRSRYHLRTSQKRLIVKLLESYSASDLRENLMLSNKKAERCIKLLSFIDYNTYSRSDEHKQAVADLRGGKLHSWHSSVEKLLSVSRDDILDFISASPDKWSVSGADAVRFILNFFAARPGMMVRMCARLLRRGYPAAEIEKRLIAHAYELSAETLITVLTKFGRMLNMKGPLTSIFERSPNAEEKREQLRSFRLSRRRRNMRFKLYKIPVTVEHDPEEVAAVYSIFENVLFRKLRMLDTPLNGKRVHLSLGEYALDSSVILFNDRSAEGGYMRSGIAYRIPENVKKLRFAVYWNHPERVDIDLHASAKGLDGSDILIGWNSNFKDSGIVFSGDITHSDAAEYIDIDLSAPIAHVTANVHLFSGADSFKDIKTCFVGMMAVDKTDENVQLSNPANYFFSHFLTSKCDELQYGYIDVVNRALVFHGAATDDDDDYYKPIDMILSRFSLARYLELLMKAQNVQLIEKAEDADLSLVMGKPMSEKECSLIDHNFFLTE